MATAKAKIIVDNIDLNPFHVHIEQYSDWHHSFEITVSTEKADLGIELGKINEGLVIDQALQKFPGKQAEITIARPNGTLNFKGYVTKVRLDHNYAGDAFVILSGFSPTYFLDGQISVESFEEMSLEDIFNQTMSDFSANVEQEVSPSYSNPIEYVVRYKETQYQFLSRLAAIYGEWFYYDGQKIVFGELPSSNLEVKLTFGSDSMLSFNYSMDLRPSNFQNQFYKYQENSILDKSMRSFQPGWLDFHSQISLTNSKKLFSEEGVQPVAHQIKDDAHIKHIAEAKKSSLVGSTMVFNGQSANPGITIGAEIEVDSRTKAFIGKYRVISATHSFNSNRDYSNIFRAIPISTAVPPVNRNVIMPEAESQIAEVTDNNDPESLGRVRVQFKWQEGMTPWLRVVTSYAGKGDKDGIVGTYFTPEIGDEVYVDFEQGNPDRPYVTGSKYHGKTPPEFFDPDNNLKAIKTRSGHTLLFNDKVGKESITISDKNGNTITFDTAGSNISISTPGTMTLSCKDLNINVEKDMTTNVGKDKTTNVDANNSINVKSNMETTVKGKKKTTVTMENAMKSTGKTTIEADTNIEVTAQLNLELSANIKSSMNGKVNASVEGAMTDIKGQAMTNITGAIVKLN